MYNLFWRAPSLPFAQKQNPIVVPPGSVVTNAASLRFVGSGMSNYGKIQQENMMRLLENFAGPTAPENPTVGQLWFDSQTSVLKICTATAPETIRWEQLNSYQVSDIEPTNPALGDIWFKKNGTNSGVMYLYDGIGRFPEKAWDAVEEGFYQQMSSPTLGVKINADTFAASEGSAPGKFKILGKDAGGNLVNSQGSVLINNAPNYMPSDVFYTATIQGAYGYIMFDRSSSAAINARYLDVNGNPIGKNIYFVTSSEDGTWLYDDGTSWRKFTPNSNQYFIGILKMSDVEKSIETASVWRTGVPIGRFDKFVQPTHQTGKIGGWQQIWPNVEYVGARDEYDAIFNKLMKLIGNPLGADGSGAFGKIITYVPNLEVLDASLRRIVSLTNDPNVYEHAGNSLITLKVPPTSQDWDLLLAACRYAVDRLENGSGVLADIPTFGFVQDGLPLHPLLRNANPTDPLTLSSYVAERKTNYRTGVISSVLRFQELLNVLDYAIRSKHTLRGTYEATASSSYPSTVINPTHATIIGDMANLATGKTLEMLLPFDNTLELESFLNSGGTVMVEVAATNKPNTTSNSADLALQSALAIRGKIKITGSQSILFNYGANAVVSIQPIEIGFNSINAGGSTMINSWTQSGVVTVIWSIGKPQLGSGLKVMLGISSTQAMTNIVNIRLSYIVDGIKYSVGGSQVNVFGAPKTFSLSDLSGTGITQSPAVYSA